MMPWPALLVFLGISAGTTTAIAMVSAAMGWTVHSPEWAVLAPIAMWAPALGRFVACRTVDRGFTSTLLFPKLFAGGENELWLGEGGLLPSAGYVVLGAALFLWTRWHGASWRELARRALDSDSSRVESHIPA